MDLAIVEGRSPDSREGLELFLPVFERSGRERFVQFFDTFGPILEADGSILEARIADQIFALDDCADLGPESVALKKNEIDPTSVLRLVPIRNRIARHLSIGHVRLFEVGCTHDPGRHGPHPNVHE